MHGGLAIAVTVVSFSSGGDPGIGRGFAELLRLDLARVPGIPVHPDGRVVSLGLDPLFHWSLGSLVAEWKTAPPPGGRRISDTESSTHARNGSWSLEPGAQVAGTLNGCPGSGLS